MTNKTADIVVIGGGVNGASTAFHLTSLGVKRVVVVERRHLAAGATGKSGSLVRMHYTNEHESRLAHESLKYFHDWKNRVGGDCGFERIGYLKLVARGHGERLARNVAVQQKIGIKTRVVSSEEVREILPGRHLDDIGGAAYEADSGFADPNATTFLLAEAAQRLGAEIRSHCEATRLVTEGGRVTAVQTTDGRIDTPAVVLVPGAWAHRLLEPLGLAFPLTPFRIQVSIFRGPPASAAATAHQRRYPRGVVPARGRRVHLDRRGARRLARRPREVPGGRRRGLRRPLPREAGRAPARLRGGDHARRLGRHHHDARRTAAPIIDRSPRAAASG